MSKYAVFSGRSRRSELWMFVLFNLIIVMFLAFLEQFFAVTMSLLPVYALIVLIPTISVIIRRLHDTSRSGWWLCFILVPVIGALFLSFYMVQEGKGYENEYGHNPKHRVR
jgi:uncharacterized membrane protein YhaH (DUF805 family)